MFNLLQFMDLIYGLVSIWVKTRKGCGNTYESQRFERVLKKDLWMLFLVVLGENYKKGWMSMWAKF